MLVSEQSSNTQGFSTAYNNHDKQGHDTALNDFKIINNTMYSTKINSN